MARLEIKGVSKTFSHEVVAVKDVSFSVADGEFLTLLGPSGCGKTTLLRLIAGLEDPDSGVIQIDDQDVTHLAPAKRNVAMVFQNYALYPHMRVFDNIAVSLRLKKLARKETRAKVAGVAQTLGIENLLERYPRELSGGQRQRVALARALVREPRLFLLDEPLSNLDAVLREKTRAELKLLFSRIRSTVIYVTHDQVEALSMSSRILVIKDGEIQQVGSPQEIYARPANKFVAGFVGSPSVSFVDATIEEGCLRFGEYCVNMSTPIPEVRRVVAGIRPEDVRLISGTPKVGDARAIVLLVEPFGSFAVATLDYAGIRLRSLVSPGKIEPQMRVRFAIDEKNLLLFDPETGSRIEQSKKE